MKKILGLLLVVMSVSSFGSMYTLNGTRAEFDENRILNQQLLEATEKYEAIEAEIEWK